MIEAQGLTRRLGERQVLRGVDLRVERGEILTLCGPNGAGKSTLLSVLALLTRPSGGRVCIAGTAAQGDTRALRERVGLVAHRSFLYGALTARENLDFYARLYRIREGEGRIRELLQLVGLYPFAHEPVRTFSRGMEQRLSLARALLHRPEVLLLDEPYAGLDPAGARLLDRILAEHRARGGAALLVTHDLAQAENLGDRLAVLVRGRLPLSARRGELAPGELARRYQELVGRLTDA